MDDTDLRIEFHESLDELRDDIIRLGAMTVEMIGKGTAAMLEQDLHAAQQIIDADDAIDMLEITIEESCYRMLALQQPMARDLRFIICCLRLANELERSADLMVNVCKASRRMYDVTMSPQVRSYIEDMSIEAASLTRKAIDAFVESDAAKANALDDIDDRLDLLQVEYMNAIINSHDTGAHGLSSAVQLALIGRYYERIGDHAVNMGERVAFMVSGWLPEHAAIARMELKTRREPAAG